MSLSTANNDTERSRTIPARPKVSVGFPVYNGEPYLEQALDSLLAQTYQDFEVIICDNASEDRTAEICQRYAARHPRVRYVRNPTNIGGMRNHQLALELATGEYFRWAAHDDICDPQLFEYLVAELDARPDVSVCVTAAVSIDEKGMPLPGFLVGARALGLRRGEEVLLTDDDGVRYPTEGTAGSAHERLREILRTKGPCEASYGLMRTGVLRDTVGLRSHTSSDTVLLCDLALRGPFHVVHRPLFAKRWHPANRYLERGPARMAWSKPELAQSGRPTLPHWLLLRGYVEVVWRSSIPWREKMRCVTPLLEWTALRRRDLLSDLTFAGTMLLRSKDWRRARYAPERWTEVSV